MNVNAYETLNAVSPEGPFAAVLTPDVNLEGLARLGLVRPAL